jgi:hypothetical protein
MSTIHNRWAIGLMLIGAGLGTIGAVVGAHIAFAFGIFLIILGIAVLFLPKRDQRVSPSSDNSLPAIPDPRVFMEYHWRADTNDDFKATRNPAVILRNGGVEAAVDVKIEDILQGGWRAVFGLVPQIHGGDSALTKVSIFYDGGNIETIDNLIALLRPATNAGLKASQVTPTLVSYGDASGQKFVSEYEFRWDHTKQECLAFLVKVRKLSASPT